MNVTRDSKFKNLFLQYHSKTRRAFDLAACRLLLKEIAVLVRSQVKPKVIFWRCVDVLVREKIEVPS
jgi:hypothetical protein